MFPIPVESTVLAAIAYDAPHQLLWLEFRSRAVYRYYGVPPAVHEALMAAPSRGAYFNRNIRGFFACEKQPAGVPQPFSPAAPKAGHSLQLYQRAQ